MITDEKRLKIALGILRKRQTANYVRQCGNDQWHFDDGEEELTACTRLGIATSLFDNDNQNNKFAELVAKHEGFTDMPSRSCKGGNCHGCKTGQRTKCPLFKPVDAVIVDRLGLTIRHKRKKEGD